MTTNESETREPSAANELSMDQLEGVAGGIAFGLRDFGLGGRGGSLSLANPLDVWYALVAQN